MLLQPLTAHCTGDPVAVRLAVSVMLAITVALILFKGNVDKISQGLGLVVVVMTVTFTISGVFRFHMNDFTLFIVIT